MPSLLIYHASYRRSKPSNRRELRQAGVPLGVPVPTIRKGHSRY